MQKDDIGSICDGTSTCEKERLACEYSDVTVVDSPSLCHSVTIISGCPRHPCKTQHRPLLPNSLIHAPSVFFQDQRMESISHLLQNGRRCMQTKIESKCECFPVANILSLKTCNSTFTLYCPELCLITAPVSTRPKDSNTLT